MRHVCVCYGDEAALRRWMLPQAATRWDAATAADNNDVLLSRNINNKRRHPASNRRKRCRQVSCSFIRPSYDICNF